MCISREQALDCFASDDLIGIGMEADAIRRRLHPEGVVSYAVDRAIDLQSTTGDFATLHAQIEEALELGGTGITLHGAADRDLAWCERLLEDLKQHFPHLALHAFSADEVSAVAAASSLPIAEILMRLRAAGLDAILGDRGLLPEAAYIDIHRAAHHAGILSTAEMVFGAGESMEQRVAFLESICALQAETSGFFAFSLRGAPAPTARELDDPTAVEYLKTLAVCRMLLDNIPNLQANLAQQGLKVLQMGLRFGGNDAGSVVAADGTDSEEEVRRIIRDAGFKPAQRDSLYRAMFLN